MYTDTQTDTQTDMNAGIRASRLRVARSRGALSGAALIILGAWAALVPFFGPYFDFAYGPNRTWEWTAARGWAEVLPGAVAFFAGLLLLMSSHRVVAMVGAWLGAAAGVWLVVAPSLAGTIDLTLGVPNPASSTGVRALEAIAYFYGVGAAILFFGAVALGRLSVHGLRDVRAAERRVAAEQAAAREEQERAVAEHEALLREAQEKESARLRAEQDAQRLAAERDAAHHNAAAREAALPDGSVRDGAVRRDQPTAALPDGSYGDPNADDDDSGRHAAEAEDLAARRR
jgi:hypothetical protein